MKHWIKTEEKLPHAWETGSWDGRRSDEVFIKDENGSYFVGRYYDFLDGYTEWYDRDDNSLKYKITEWMEIPVY